MTEQLRRNADKVERVLDSHRHLVKPGNCIPAAIAWCSGLVHETEIALAATKAPVGTRSWRSCLAAAERTAVVVETLNNKHRGWYCLHMVDRNPLRAHAVAVCFRTDDVAVVFDGGFRYEVPASKLKLLMNSDRRAFALSIGTDCCTPLNSWYADQHAGMQHNLDDTADMFASQPTPPELADCLKSISRRNMPKLLQQNRLSFPRLLPMSSNDQLISLN